MKQKRFNTNQIIAILGEQTAGCLVDDICRRHHIGHSTFYKSKSQYGGMSLSKAKRLRELVSENTKLKRLLADAMLDNAALKDVLSKKW